MTVVAPIVGCTVTPAGRFILDVRCPWCRRTHQHAIVRGHSDYQAPSCGTPAGYWLKIPALTRRAIAEGVAAGTVVMS